MKPAEKIERLIKKSRYKANPETYKKALGSFLQAVDEHQRQKSASTEPIIRRIIMKSPITKLAAAAVIIIAVLIGINQIGSTPTFAEVVQPFLTARTATFKVTIKGEGVPKQEFDGMFMEPGRMRHNQPGGGTVIVDIEQGKFVTLLPQLNQAVVLEIYNIPEEPGSLNFFQEIRMRILKAKPFDDESVEFLGEKEIDGITAIGYHVQKPGLDATVWADSETKMPIQIEVFQDPMTIAMSNIVFNVELDEKLFIPEVPEGYDVKILRKDMSEPKEEDFIESFRIWAEHMDGNFPSKMHMSAVNEFMKYQQKKMKEKGTEPSIEDITQLQQTIIDMTHGFPFAESLPAESDWKYVGGEVKFGDANAPIFWYRPKKSQTYRVIYGDLSVKDVASENLPR
jgi:outer membrane lipoprotein-sorting protein